MSKRYRSIFKKLPDFSPVLWLLVVTLISYGKTLRMYWWVDDWTLLYKMVRPESIAGYIGGGIFGQGSYKYLATPFIFLYRLFGANATPYFAIGLILYFLAAFTVYLLVKEIAKNRTVGIVASTVFASGYIASYALYRLSNSYQFTLTTIFINLTALFLVKYIWSKRIKFYFLSLILFVATIQFLFLRSHGVLPVVFSLFVVLGFKRGFKNVISLAFKFLPFLAIYYLMYMRIYTHIYRSGGFMSELVNNFLGGRVFASLGNFLSTISSTVIPDPLTAHIHAFQDSLLKINISLVNLSQMMGLLVVFAIVSVAFFIRKRNIVISRILILGLLFVISGNISYFIYTPTTIFYSAHRYFMPSFVGTAFIYSGLFLIISDYLFPSKKVGKVLGCLLIGGLSVYLISLSYKDQDQIIKYISYPTQNAYKVIKENIPKVDKDTVIFIDAEDDPRVRNNILSGMGRLGVSIFYNYEGQTKLVSSAQDLYQMLLNKEASLDNIYTFFISDKLGFVPTTDEFRKEINQKLEPLVINNWDYSNKGVFIESEVDYPSLMPTALKLNLSLKTKEAVKGETVPIRIWWMTERRNTYQLFYSQEINILADGYGHFYTIYIPAQGLKVQKLRIDGYPTNSEIKVINSTIQNLTLPEVKGKEIPYYH